VCDGLAIAEYVKEHHPEAYELLTKVHITHSSRNNLYTREGNPIDPTDPNSKGDAFELCHTHPILGLDEKGRLDKVVQSETKRGVCALPYSVYEPFMEAYVLWSQLVEDPRFVQKMGEAADISSAAKDYGNALNSATTNVSQLADDYTKVSESLTGLEAAGEMSSTVGSAMQQMTENLTSLNDMYGAQLEQLKVNAELYTGMGELVQNLNDSVEDTKLYKENIAELSKKLASLNSVYGNMLNAMGQ
jgi:hypothetical protein